MKQFVTRGTVLTRTNYGEADRILTILTPTDGKLRLIAKGVRRPKSKLAGGIELLSVSDITYIRGRGEIGTLISARLERHYRHIVEDYDRTMLAYELLKKVHRATEDETDEAYFALLEQALALLDDAVVEARLVRVWFCAQLLTLDGYTPNLNEDASGNTLDSESAYIFRYEDAVFEKHESGQFSKDHIKFLRILFSPTSPLAMQRVQGIDALLETCSPLVITLFEYMIRQ